MLFKIHKKIYIKVTPHHAAQAAKSIVKGPATSADGLSSLDALEIMFCDTVGLCASFHLCCLWGLDAHYKTVIIISNLSPSVPRREA